MNNLPSKIQDVGKPGWFSNPKNIASTVILTAIFGVAGYFFLTYALPWLVTVTWNAISLGIGGVVLFFLYFILSNKKFWRALKYLSEFIASFTLGVVIELNPFKIIAAQIEQGYIDAKELIKQQHKVAGKKEDLDHQLNEQNNFLLDNKYKYEELQRINKDHEYDDEITLYANNVQRAVDFIQQVQPISNDLAFIEEFCKKAHKSVLIKLEDAKSELKIKKAAYEAVTSGLSVASAAWKALNGDDGLNQDAEKAAEIIRSKVSKSLAEMKNTMQLTNQVMKDIDLKNVVRARKGIETIKQMNSDQSASFIGSSANFSQKGNSRQLQEVKQEHDKSKDRFKGLMED